MLSSLYVLLTETSLVGVLVDSEQALGAVTATPCTSYLIMNNQTNSLNELHLQGDS